MQTRYTHARYTGNCQICPTHWWVLLWKSSVQMLFEDERFQIGFEGGKTWSIRQRFGEGIPGHRSCVWESTLSILVEFDAWSSHETSGKVDRKREDQTSRQVKMNPCYDSTGLKSSTQSELGLATSGKIWENVLHGLALICQGQDELHCFVLSAGCPACFRGDPPAKSCSSPTLTERRMKSASSSHQQMSYSASF